MRIFIKIRIARCDMNDKSRASECTVAAKFNYALNSRLRSVRQNCPIELILETCFVTVYDTALKMGEFGKLFLGRF